MYNLWNLSPFCIRSLHFALARFTSFFLSLPLFVFLPGITNSDNYIGICFSLQNRELRDYHTVVQLFAWMFLFKLDGELWTRAGFLFMFLSLSSHYFRSLIKLQLNECSLVHKINNRYQCQLFKPKEMEIWKIVIGIKYKI